MSEAAHMPSFAERLAADVRAERALVAKELLAILAVVVVVVVRQLWLS